MKQTVLHILGNLKGGVITPEQAYEAINATYKKEIQKIRYPGEPQLYLGDRNDIVPIPTFERNDH